MTDTRQQHWDGVYGRTDDAQASWFQPSADTSVRLVGLACPARPSTSLLDVGAGTSRLVDAMLDEGRDVTVLDVSGEALGAVARRLGPRADRVERVQADVLAWQPQRTYDVWHDRAVFHFLTEADEVAAYVELATRAVAARGAVVLGVFAPDGPRSCSGLPTARHDAASLSACFGEAFALEHDEREVHHTPSGGAQAFTWVVLRRR